jgi:hypothetical protein
MVSNFSRLVGLALGCVWLAGSPGVVRAAEVPSLDAPPVVSVVRKKDAAVVVGLEDYASLPDVPFAKADAQAFASHLRARGIPAARVRLLLDPRAKDVRAAVEAAAREARDTLWIYVAGDVLPGADGAALAGVDADAEGGGTLSVASLTRVALAGKAKRVLVVLDAQPGDGRRDGRASPGVDLLAGVAPHKRLAVWAASTRGEPVTTWDGAGHGIFTWAALGGLHGWADGEFGSADGDVTLEEAQAWTARVARQVSGGAMRPERDARADVKRWVVSSGGLVKGPTAAELVELARLARAERVLAAEEDVRALATAEWETLAPSVKTRSASAIAALEAFAAKWDTFTITVDGQSLGVSIPEVASARTKLDGWSRASRKGKRQKGRKVAAPPPPPPQAACKDLLALETKAIAGELSTDDRACIDSRIASEKKQTGRDKLSRLLLVDADTRGDTERWATLMARHLEHIDRSDPDLCFRWALHLSRGGMDQLEGSVHWADVALENKHQWEGPRHVARVYGLLQLRAETLHRLWMDSELDFQAERSEENMAETDLWRGRAKTAARDWLDYAKVSGQDVVRARTLCESAAGSPDFCPR